MKNKILLWDNDGTIMGSKNPHDLTNNAKIILPNVKETMLNAEYNFIISGCKTAESETQNFDPEKITAKFTELMKKLPIQVAIFSPAIGGVECYGVIKKSNNSIEIRKIHEDLKYQKFIGQFKKPGIGMFEVIRDIADLEFNQKIDKNTSIMIGDTWHDKKGAEDFGIPFKHANEIHKKIYSQNI